VKRVLAMLFVSALAVLLVYVAALLPPMGDAGNPTNTAGDSPLPRAW
jgi:hypothetical protein